MPKIKLLVPPYRVLEAGHWAEVAALPKCDACTLEKHDAHYDAATRGGRWGYFCPTHFSTLDCRTGLGLGQRLVLPGDFEVMP